MFNHPLDFLISPLLIAQGIYTKYKVPHLDSPIGNRYGFSGTGNRLRLLITGDSSAEGIGVSTQNEALLGQLITQLSHTYQCEYSLSAQSGFSTQSLLKSLKHKMTYPYDLIVVVIGVNDVTKPLWSTTWKKQLQSLHHVLQNEYMAQHIIYTAIPPMQYFTALPQPLRYCLGKNALFFNQILKQHCDATSSLLFQPKFELSKQYLAEDGFHPNAKAYSIWAKQLATFIIEHLK